MEIEKISQDQVFRIQEIANKTWPDTFRTILSEEQIKYMLEWMYNLEVLSEQIEKGHEFFIVKENEIDLGFIGVEINYPSESIAKIHKIYILPNTQGKGIGKYLIQFIEDYLIKNDQINTLFLNVNRFNKATDFYKKLGFNIIKEENIDIGNGFFMEDFVMQKSIISSNVNS